MTRGRRPKPEAVKALMGNPGKRRLKLGQPEQSGASPTPTVAPKVSIAAPEFLTSERSKTVFRRVVEDLVVQRIARVPDLTAYGRWAFYVDRWVAQKEALEGKDLTYESASSYGKLLRKHPAFVAMIDLERVLESLEDRLALNPVARQNYLRGLAALPRSLGDLFDGEKPDQPVATSAPGGTATEVTPPPPESPLGFLKRAGQPLN